MEKTDILIIGAGICGLAAAKALLDQGYRVILLEARERTGGRVYTHLGQFSHPVFAGPEFIHGDLPLTKALVQETGATLFEHSGNMYRSKNQEIFPVDPVSKEMDQVMSQLSKLEKDMTLSDFLNTWFGKEEHKALRASVTSLAEGFDAADADRVNVFALRDEWSSGSLESSYIIKEGYGALVDSLSKACERAGGFIFCHKEVHTVVWKKGNVKVLCTDQTHYESKAILVTVPLGILTAAPSERGYIRFKPDLPEKWHAARQIGYGMVVKVVFEFKTCFWKQDVWKDKAAQIPDLGFLMSDGAFPIFWTTDNDLPVLTAWAGGSQAEKLMYFEDQKIVQIALSDLARAFLSSVKFLQEQLAASAVFNWVADPFSKGAYSYETPETKDARCVLTKPVQETIYFAGEALGNTMGTIEAALESAAFTVQHLFKDQGL